MPHFFPTEDVTEKAEREQQMRLQSQVIANMAEGVAIVHADTGHFAYANPRFEQMMGYGTGELNGKHVSIINAPTDQDPMDVAHRVIAELRLHGHWRGEVKNIRADGREIWTRSTISEFVHEDMGKVWVAVHTDITDQRQALHARDEALAQLRRLSLNIQDSIEAERLAVSREVHDQLGAALTGMRMKLESLAARLGPESAALANALQEVARTARHTQLAARDICNHLRPQVLDDMGLVEACRWYARDWSTNVGIPVRSRFVTPKTEPDGRLATDMFRVMQELLTNVARHAAATQVQLSLSGNAEGLTLQVQDNGHGFAPEQVSGGFGLMGVRERVRQHGGEFQLESGAGGTTVRVSMPYVSAP